MARMKWDDFQRDHHRPHLLIVSVETPKEGMRPTSQVDFERLAVSLGVVGNYAGWNGQADTFPYWEQ